MADQLMTFNEAKKYLRVSRATLYRYATEGKIPAFKMVGQWRFNKGKLNTWLESHRNKVKKGKKG